MLSFSSASALSCVDLSKNISRYQENSSVLLLQNFLFDKGFLKAKPNGYFGAGTFAAVKAYQKSVGLEQFGGVGPGTRQMIKKETCGLQGGASTSSQTPTLSTASKPVTPAPTLPLTRNDRRMADAEVIIKALYRYFVDSRGVHAVSVGDTPKEMCVVTKPLEATVASTSEAAVLVTKDSPCKDYIDVSYLVPGYLSSLPRDPSLATTSNLLGYMITRSSDNDITIEPKTVDNKAIIKVTCNFNGFCKNIEHITKQTYKRPIITSLNRNIFLRDAIPRTPLIIRGENFTATNTVKLYSLYNSKEYSLGDFASTNYTATTTAIPVDGPFLNQTFPCGTNCAQKLPLGEYTVTVTSEGGTSNPGHLVLRGFTTSSISTQINSSIIPTTKNVKVATITVSSSIPVTLKSLTLTSTSTSKNLSSKLSNFVLKDQSDGTTYAGGSGTFSFSNLSMYENQSKVYDVYVDTAEVLVEDAGFITYGGKFLVSDSFAVIDLELPIKEFSFTVSH